jgi:glycosyltransferase involved in cell wall biosynthesis
MPRILFCLDFYPPHIGGAEILFRNLAEGLARAGWEVEVITQMVKDAQAEEVRNNVHIRRIATGGIRHLFPLLVLPTLFKAAGRADLIHCTTFASTLPSWLVAKWRRKPLALTVHEVWVGKWSLFSDASPLANGINGLLERIIYLFDYQNYITVSHATERALKAIGTPADRITTIYNGIDNSHWKPDGQIRDKRRQDLGLQDHFVFFFSGRPGRSKGLPTLLRAFAAVAKRHPEARLLTILSNNAAVAKGLADAQRLIQELNIAEKVLIHPPVPYGDLPGYVMCADTVVVPSLSEGFGFAAAEACALERPVIATDNASLPEVVSGKVLLVPPRDVDALANAMESALAGQFTMVPPKRFPNEETLASHIRLYHRILGISKDMK